MYGCESWTIKKAEHRRIDALELWCWRRLLRVAWTARRSILKELSPEYSLEGLMMKLKLQYFGHLMWRTDSLEKTLMLGKIEGGRKRGWQRMRWLDCITDVMEISLSRLQEWRTGKPGMLQSMRSQRVRHDWVTELTEVTELKNTIIELKNTLKGFNNSLDEAEVRVSDLKEKTMDPIKIRAEKTIDVLEREKRETAHKNNLKK